MTHTKLAAHVLLTGFALLSLNSALKASAAPTTVSRGPHGAAFVVDSKVVPQSTTSMVKMTAAKMDSGMKTAAVPSLINRGPHGAAIIPN